MEVFVVVSVIVAIILGLSIADTLIDIHKALLRRKQ